MDLPETDEAFLKGKGYSWRLVPDRAGACLIITGYAVNPDVYDRPQTDLMLRIPAQYNLAGLDMYYVDPPLRLKGGGYPRSAESFERHVERQWQRFSRHLPRPWRTGVDDLRMFFALINQELHAGRQPG